ncbi:MAG: electron transport complex subunit RsxC [Pseudomonadales bacterium]
MTRRVFDIPGGVHPPENKSQSLSAPITAAGIPELLVLPLSQTVGAPAKAIVQVGDEVLKGQLIAEANGFISAPVHAPSSGTIVALDDQLIAHSSGMTAPCITLQTDGKDEWIDHEGIVDYRNCDKQKLLQLIRDAGIAGLGGAGFPTAVKLNPPADKPITSLVINGTECEPYITADHILMRERAADVVHGIEILAYLLAPQEILVGVEDNKPDAIAALRKAAEGTAIEIVEFPTKYPSGGEKQLIEILTGKEVPSGGLPADIGIVCQNIGTIYAVTRAVEHGESLISRITTITGTAVAQPCNMEVLLGTPMRFLLEQCGWQSEEMSRLVMGGPMMGFTMPSADVPVVKTTNCILAPTEQEFPTSNTAQACIRCGLCAEACPASLLPQQLYWFARAKEYEKLEDHHLVDCIECGACSYVCPSNIPLVQYYRASKAEIRHRDLEHIKSEQARERFEAREARLEKLKQEKQAKRKARKEAAKKTAASSNAEDPKQAEIQAAVARAKAKKENVSDNQDPVQAAIERAQAKRAQAAAALDDKLTQLQKTLASADKKLGNTRAKLEQAKNEGSDNIALLEGSLGKLEEKRQEAQQALEDFQRQGRG